MILCLNYSKKSLAISQQSCMVWVFPCKFGSICISNTNYVTCWKLFNFALTHILLKVLLHFTMNFWIIAKWNSLWFLWDWPDKMHFPSTWYEVVIRRLRPSQLGYNLDIWNRSKRYEWITTTFSKYMYKWLSRHIHITFLQLSVQICCELIAKDVQSWQTNINKAKSETRHPDVLYEI